MSTHPNQARMNTDARQQVDLPQPVLNCIKSIASDASLSPNERLTGALMLIYGLAWYQRQETIDPNRIKLLARQWLEICSELALGVPDDSFAGVNLGLSFMNSGPSAGDQ